VVVIGAGPAGLTAAVYLARFRRRVLVLGDGPSRTSWIPQSHNTPGFPHGVAGPELLARLTEQALEYGAELRSALATALSAVPEGFAVETADGTVRASAVLLCTGVRDILPPLPGVDDAIRRGIVRMCPICDAYEAIGARIAVLGAGGLADREAAFLGAYSDDVTVIPPDEGTLRITATGVGWIRPGDADEHLFDHLYLALGCAPQASLATGCGARCAEDGNLVVDAHQMTSVDGLYAAGDVVRGLNQIAVAAGEAAIAATAIHNRLRSRA